MMRGLLSMKTTGFSTLLAGFWCSSCCAQARDAAIINAKKRAGMDRRFTRAPARKSRGNESRSAFDFVTWSPKSHPQIASTVVRPNLALVRSPFDFGKESVHCFIHLLLADIFVADDAFMIEDINRRPPVDVPLGGDWTAGIAAVPPGTPCDLFLFQHGSQVFFGIAVDT